MEIAMNVKCPVCRKPVSVEWEPLCKSGTNTHVRKSHCECGWEETSRVALDKCHNCPDCGRAVLIQRNRTLCTPSVAWYICNIRCSWCSFSSTTNQTMVLDASQSLAKGK